MRSDDAADALGGDRKPDGRAVFVGSVTIRHQRAQAIIELGVDQVLVHEPDAPESVRRVLVA